jgi:hypothetical protein
VLITFPIGELLVPPYQAKLFGVLWPQPPMIRLAFKVKAVVAAIWALNFHTPITILPKQTKSLCFRPLHVRLAEYTSGYS